jgi:REP element-mobilizing transposase RayT
MARPLRIQYPGAIYHVLSRGDRRESIFRNDADRELFLELLAQICVRTGWQIHAYCLMDNHFHLVIETPRSNLSAGMQWLLGSYTQQFNRRHRLWGHLFGGRYKALLVDSRRGGTYLRQVCDYVHLNPVRAAMLSGKNKVHSYRWSSCAHYLASRRKRPAWLRTDRLMGEHGLTNESARSRREFSRRMESLRQEANRPQQLQPIRRGWKLGAEDFLDWILEKMEVQTKEAHPARERDETEQAKAMRIVQEELKRLEWTQTELKRRRKGDESKVALARRLRRETAVSLRWIAENLHMGSWTHVSNRLSLARHER